MEYYNNQTKRDLLMEQMPDLFVKAKSPVMSFINLCLYPYKFEVTFTAVKTQTRLSSITYGTLKAAIAGLLVLANRQHKESSQSIDLYVIDFIEFIRGDKKNDPTRFLLSMRRYMPRYLLLKGLQHSFGIDWRTLITEALELKSAPTAVNYHTILTNIYVRNLVRVYVVWKNYLDQHEDGYELGTNDVNTLLDKAALFKTALTREKLVALFESLQANLPSWSYSVRRRAAWAIDTSFDGMQIIERQMTPFKYKNTCG